MGGPASYCLALVIQTRSLTLRLGNLDPRHAPSCGEKGEDECLHVFQGKVTKPEV